MVEGGVMSVLSAVCSFMVVLCVTSEHGAVCVMSANTEQCSTFSEGRAHVDAGEENGKQQHDYREFGGNSHDGGIEMT